MVSDNETKLKALGASAEKNKELYRYDNPDPSVLETFPNSGPYSLKEVVLTVLNSTSLCPLTGQPDYSKIQIRYVPDKKCIETKSLKLYLMQYRNFGAFCEQTAVRICNDVMGATDAFSVEITVFFESRGDIEIKAVARIDVKSD